MVLDDILQRRMYLISFSNCSNIALSKSLFQSILSGTLRDNKTLNKLALLLLGNTSNRTKLLKNICYILIYKGIPGYLNSLEFWWGEENSIIFTYFERKDRILLKLCKSKDIIIYHVVVFKQTKMRNIWPFWFFNFCKFLGSKE